MNNILRLLTHWPIICYTAKTSKLKTLAYTLRFTLRHLKWSTLTVKQIAINGVAFIND